MEYRVDLMDGTSETNKAHAVKTTPETIEFRTTPYGTYSERWIKFPMVNVKSWRRVD